MKLIVRENENTIAELELDPAQEYYVGRSRQCQVILTHPEISRRHLKFKYIGGHWECELLSQFGNLYTHGHPVNRLSLAHGAQFNVVQFNFFYEEIDKTVALPESADKTLALGLNSGTIMDKPNTNTGADKTFVVESKLKFVLLRCDRQDEPFEEIVLSEGLIEAGRDDDCQILLRDPKASRKHFSLTPTHGGFVIKDLDSKGGTSVNGKSISEEKLQSGDKISVGTETFVFQEIHSGFENLPATTNIHALDPVENNEPAVAAVAVFTQSTHRRNLLRPIVAALAGILVLIFILKDNGPKKNTKDQLMISNSPQTNDSFARLSPSQKKYLDDTYNLSYNLYTTGKYEMAAIEVSKIFKVVPNYKDAKNIESLCAQALEIKKQKDESDRIRRQQKDLQMKVDSMLVDCEELNNARKYSQVESCVSRVTEIDPENERAKWLVDNANQQLESQEAKRAAKADSYRRKLAAQRLFDRAKDSFNKKRYPAAVSDLNDITKMDFADDSGLKKKAIEALKASKEKMRQDSEVLSLKGKTALDNREYKAAINWFTAAVQMDPSNEEAKESRGKAAAELRIEMKNLYSESVIEENMGNIESAKKKWRVILEQDMKADPYYEKAKLKLGKYER